MSLDIGEILTLDIGNIANGGHFVARHDNQIIFVRHAISGETAKVKITAINSKFAFGDAVEILQSSKDRVPPPCKYSHPEGCGGCDFQHINYDVQSDLKKEVLKDQFKRITKVDISPDIVTANPPNGLHWRSRLNLAISENKKVGLRAHKSNSIIEIDECLIALKEINKSNIFMLFWVPGPCQASRPGQVHGPAHRDAGVPRHEP